MTIEEIERSIREIEEDKHRWRRRVVYPTRARTLFDEGGSGMMSSLKMSQPMQVLVSPDLAGHRD
jgi:hypothetical protein